MQALVVDFAKTQLAPKLNENCIPEWLFMVKSAKTLYKKCVALARDDLVVNKRMKFAR